MKRSLLLTLLLAIASAAVGDETEEIRRLDREINVATWTGDALWFAENLAEDFVMITPSGSIRSRADVIRELSTPGLKMDPYESTEVRIRMYEGASVVTGRILQRFVLGGARFANDLRYTDTWVKRKGGWLLASSHISAVAVKR